MTILKVTALSYLIGKLKMKKDEKERRRRLREQQSENSCVALMMIIFKKRRNKGFSTAGEFKSDERSIQKVVLKRSRGCIGTKKNGRSPGRSRDRMVKRRDAKNTKNHAE